MVAVCSHNSVYSLIQIFHPIFKSKARYLCDVNYKTYNVSTQIW